LGKISLKGIPLETLSEVVEFVENERIACRSVRGVAASNYWLFAGDESRTTVTAIVAYQLPGQLMGEFMARLVSREIVETVTASLVNLKRILEGVGRAVAGKEG
jgi:uncharacterized membrane protein